MFINPKFTRKNAPAFRDSFVSFGDTVNAVTFMKAYIDNDTDKPPKTLVSIDLYTIPVEDVEEGIEDSEDYDLSAFCCLTPEDAIRFAKTLIMLVREVFDEMNYSEHIAKPEEDEEKKDDDDDD